MAEYKFPAIKERRMMGTRPTRLDGIEKASGRAKYSSDLVKPAQLYGAILVCPHAHAKLVSLDMSAAEKMPGVKGVHQMTPTGFEIQWADYEIAAVAAETEAQARDAVKAIKAVYDPLPHVVLEQDLKKAGNRVKPAGERIEGDPDLAFKSAEVVSEGYYEIPALAHCTLETHGSVVEWKDSRVEFNPSTQSMTPIRAEMARLLKVPADQVHAHQDHIGGGFGSKFAVDRWGDAAAQLSKKSGGRPVKIFLERGPDIVIAGVRNSAMGQIKLGAKKDGTITAWESRTWGTGGTGGGGMPPIPYSMTRIPNQRLNHSSVSLNLAPLRAWRAPNHQQASFLTMAAVDDLAAKLRMDPIEVLIQNKAVLGRPYYEKQLRKAAELADWKKLWHQRGESGPGPVKRGLGVGICTWAGLGHGCTARCTINPDGTVTIDMCTQDLGTGTRTVIAQVAAEVLGLKLAEVTVRIGDSDYPPGGTSGGSTTVGGVSAATLKAAINAREKLFEKAAASLEAQPADLILKDSSVQVKGKPGKTLAWKAACQKIGMTPISETGVNDPRTSIKEGLNDQGVGGVQIADVSVDVETGVVKMNRLIAVQDMGLVINPRLAESQIYGACIMSICGALMEERIVDPVTGRILNADMEFYKLAGIKDIGEIVAFPDIDEEHDKRGVIGLGEPPSTGGIGAISNAVANAIGVRVPQVPLTPQRVLNALMKRS